jgi:disease resistance protein RPS2
MSQKKNRSPLEDLANQSFISCNDQVEQNFVMDNNVINDSIQQTTQFPPSSSQAIVSAHA